MVLVLPGSPEVFASFPYPVSILISEDLPTFERPINAISGRCEDGNPSGVKLLLIYRAERIIISAA
jgi:hypothetical protein